MSNYIKFKHAIVLVMVLMFSACMEDEGNYDYIEINEVSIDGLPDNYEVLQLDYFNIVPELSFTLDENEQGKYSYKWEAIQTLNVIGGDKVFELSTERDLLERVTLTPGEYELYYTVKDLTTELEVHKKFKLKVVTGFSEGWLLLSDTNNGARLDMVSKVGGEFNPIYNVLEGSGIELSGTADFVYTYPYKPNFYGIYVSTSGNGTIKLEPDTFEWKSIYNLSSEFVTSQPTDLRADKVMGTLFNWGYANVGGDLYHYYNALGKFYGVKVNYIDNEPFEASPISCMELTYGGYAMFYDNTNKRFVRNSQFGISSVMPNPAPESRLFDYTTGKDILYMVNNTFGGDFYYSNIFALLKDPATSKSYVAQFISWSGQQKHYSEIEATDFDKATTYAISPNYGYLFYAVGSKLYQYDIFTKQTKLMEDLGSEEITLIKFEPFLSWWNPVYAGMDKKLIVCSYDPSEQDGSNGAMRLYYVPEVNKQIELEATYTGFGKIKSIAYRER
ncbi:PKD-like family lipoprotein [Aestuariibaculum sp. M13]|uniref:PKD-like family lipoprotein n=1 Tax=Aestuariibaculum sp. M13 TaxID=2967132 RepID=UPI002159F0D3|nr:PKD-like family lipoprotein [Aestuariibaculum sp. M13]MCR8669024.1 PKD-like family lipoprotein [Aestuariibaculum sp. M13]